MEWLLVLGGFAVLVLFTVGWRAHERHVRHRDYCLVIVPARDTAQRFFVGLEERYVHRAYLVAMEVAADAALGRYERTVSRLQAAYAKGDLTRERYDKRAGLARGLYLAHGYELEMALIRSGVAPSEAYAARAACYDTRLPGVVAEPAGGEAPRAPVLTVIEGGKQAEQ